jgi:hypothetical protein
VIHGVREHGDGFESPWISHAVGTQTRTTKNAACAGAKEPSAENVEVAPFF